MASLTSTTLPACWYTVCWTTSDFAPCLQLICTVSLASNYRLCHFLFLDFNPYISILISPWELYFALSGNWSIYLFMHVWVYSYIYGFKTLGCTFNMDVIFFSLYVSLHIVNDRSKERELKINEFQLPLLPRWTTVFVCVPKPHSETHSHVSIKQTERSWNVLFSLLCFCTCGQLCSVTRTPASPLEWDNCAQIIFRSPACVRLTALLHRLSNLFKP